MATYCFFGLDADGEDALITFHTETGQDIDLWLEPKVFPMDVAVAQSDGSSLVREVILNSPHDLVALLRNKLDTTKVCGCEFISGYGRDMNVKCERHG